ncbi:MAG: hypothetical protein V2A74_05580, partial [bacterium]
MLVVCIVVNLSIAGTPPFHIDEQQYHLTIPKLFLQAGRLASLDLALSVSNYPLGMEMLYTWCMLLSGPILAKLLNFYCGILVLGVVLALARELKLRWPLLALLLFYSDWTVHFSSIQANVDLLVTLYDGVAVVLLARAWRIERETGRDALATWLLSALFVGAGLSVKYTNGWGVVGWVAAYGYVRGRALLHRPAAEMRQLLLAGLLVALPFAPYAVKNWVFAGNPVAPFLKSVFQKDAPKSDPYMAERTELMASGQYPARTLLDHLLLPYHATVYGEWGNQSFDSTISPFYLLLLPFLIFLRGLPKAGRTALIFSLLYLAAWWVTFPLTRYLIVVFPLWAVLGVWVWERMVDKSACFEFGVVARRIGNSVFVLALGAMTFYHLLQFITINPSRYLLEMETKEEFLLRRSIGGYHYLVVAANHYVPDDGKILLLWEKRNFYLNAATKQDVWGSYLAKLFYDNNGDASAVANELKSQGFTHILCDYFLPKRWFGKPLEGMEDNADPEHQRKVYALMANELRQFDELKKTHLEEIVTYGTYGLYTIK